MALEIKGLDKLREHLERLRIEDVAAQALAEQAERLAGAVRDRLSTPPGAGDHDQPWLQTGELRHSIGITVDGLEAAVGTSSPAAVPQELGTSRMHARPFLAPTAIALGESIALGIAAAIAAALAGETLPAPATPAAPSSADGAPSGPYNAKRILTPGLGTTHHTEGTPDDGKIQPDTPASAKPGDATLTDERRNYILNGNGKGGGGHGPGRETPGKSNFPSDWSDEKTIKDISEVANDPQSTRTRQDNGRTTVSGTRDGVDMEIIIGRDGSTIVTAYPTNIPKNPE